LQAGSIITNRLIMILATIVISSQGSYYTVWPCAKIEFTLPHPETLVSTYPSCAAYANGSDPQGVSAVKADLGGDTEVNVGAGLGVSFGMALWLAVVLHAIGVEVYLALTPKEAQRLREVSYKRQLQAGMRSPGSEGLTADRLGDAERWNPREAITPDGTYPERTIVTATK
jgi:hypothetical protein